MCGCINGFMVTTTQRQNGYVITAGIHGGVRLSKEQWGVQENFKTTALILAWSVKTEGPCGFIKAVTVFCACKS